MSKRKPKATAEPATPIVLPAHCPIAGSPVVDRVKFLAEMIVRNYNGDSKQSRDAYRTAIAERWNVTPNVVSNMTGEAFRLLKLGADEVDEIRATAAAIFRRDLDSEDPDIRQMGFDNLDRLFQLCPAKTTKIDLNVSTMTEEEMLRRLRGVLRQPDPITAKALELEGYVRINALEAQGSEVSE